MVGQGQDGHSHSKGTSKEEGRYDGSRASLKFGRSRLHEILRLENNPESVGLGRGLGICSFILSSQGPCTSECGLRTAVWLLPGPVADADPQAPLHSVVIKGSKYGSGCNGQ